jgi:hypothetical protein
MQNEEIRLQPLENRSVWGSNCLPQGGEAVLPLPQRFGGRSDGTCRRHRGAPRRLRGTRRRPWHAPLLPQAAPRRACSSAASAALGDGGGGVHHSGGARPPSLSSSSSNDDEYSEAAGGESPCCSRSRYSSSLCSRAPAAGSSAPSCASPALAPAAAPCVCARAGSGHGRAGPRGVHGHPLLETTQC